MKMWLLIVILRVNAGFNLTMHDFETEKDCLEVLSIIQKDSGGSGFSGSLEHGECKAVTEPRRYR